MKALQIFVGAAFLIWMGPMPVFGLDALQVTVVFAFVTALVLFKKAGDGR